MEMERAVEVVDKIAEQTDEVILFHSASGKDSIVLADLLSPRFKRVVCVYMYMIKGMECQERFINYARHKYKNLEFTQVPHFARLDILKHGDYGQPPRPSLKQYNLMELTEIVRGKTGLEWAFYGFKQSDSLNRRIMLRQYDMQAINYKTKKVYPLSTYLNKDCIKYIREHDLIYPEILGTQSSGVAISNGKYLYFLKKFYPRDLKKVYADFPLVERNLFEYERMLEKMENEAEEEEIE